jgi:hypothetical protein
MTEFPTKNIPIIRKLLKEFAARTKSFRITSSSYRQNKHGYVDVDYKKSKDIKRLQKKIVTLLNPMREGNIRERDRKRMRKMTKVEQKNIKLYGYRAVGNMFSPHLTFSKLKKFDGTAIPKIDKSNFSFEVNKIGFFYLGDYGTCRKPIEVFNFSW